MPTITINLGSEITDITSYDVFISECDPISWQLVADDISYDDFPIYVDPAGFNVDGPCFEYYISGDTSCDRDWETLTYKNIITCYVCYFTT